MLARRAARRKDGCVLALSASLLRASTARGDIGDRRARQLFLQSLDRGRRRLAQNRKDMSADRTGCARRRPVLGEELAALQRGEDIAQGDVARRPRQFESASRTEPSADQSRRRHQREEAANHDRIGVGAIRHILRTQRSCLDWRRAQSANERRRQIGCSFPSLTLRTARADLAKPTAPPRGASQAMSENDRADTTSDTAATQASRTLAVARPAAGLEPRAAADEGLAAAAAAGGGRTRGRSRAAAAIGTASAARGRETAGGAR